MRAPLLSSAKQLNKSEQHPSALQSWRGKVTRLLPPHYGIVDGVAFYVSAAVVGDRKLAVWLRMIWPMP